MRITTAIATGSNSLKENAVTGGTFDNQNHDLKERFGERFGAGEPCCTLGSAGGGGETFCPCLDPV